MQLMKLVSAAGSLLNVVCAVVLLVVVAGAVRRHRPDAYGSLLAWAIVGLVATIVMPLLHTLIPLFAVRSAGVDAVLTVQASMIGVNIILHVVMVVLLARGLVAIAQPPKPVVVESNIPYR